MRTSNVAAVAAQMRRKAEKSRNGGKKRADPFVAVQRNRRTGSGR